VDVTNVIYYETKVLCVKLVFTEDLHCQVQDSDCLHLESYPNYITAFLAFLFLRAEKYRCIQSDSGGKVSILEGGGGGVVMVSVIVRKSICVIICVIVNSYRVRDV
jgi:hypothetical protein